MKTQHAMKTEHDRWSDILLSTRINTHVVLSTLNKAGQVAL